MLPGSVLQTTEHVIPSSSMADNDLVMIQDTAKAASQAELINQLQNHITDNQQILIITDDQGQDQCTVETTPFRFFVFLSFVSS